MSRLTDSVGGSRTIEKNFLWSDCGAYGSEDGTHIYDWINTTGAPACFEGVEIVNGATACTTHAPIVQLSTENCDYIITGSATQPANSAMYQNMIGEDLIPPDGLVYATIPNNGVPTAAVEAKLRITYRMAA